MVALGRPNPIEGCGGRGLRSDGGRCLVWTKMVTRRTLRKRSSIDIEDGEKQKKKKPDKNILESSAEGGMARIEFWLESYVPLLANIHLFSILPDFDDMW